MYFLPADLTWLLVSSRKVKEAVASTGSPSHPHARAPATQDVVSLAARIVEDNSLVCSKLYPNSCNALYMFDIDSFTC